MTLELSIEAPTLNGKTAEEIDDDIAEGLDLITAMYNYLTMIGLSKEDFDKHIEKLERYKETKYKK